MKKQPVALILVVSLVVFITAAAAFFAYQKTSAATPIERYGASGGLQRHPVEGSPSYHALPLSQASASDVERGRKLFMGNLHLQNDGPPCIGCHNADSNGILGGGVVGPDLTDVSTRLGEAGLAAALTDIIWPTMLPIYSPHPLTAAEQADLTAFLVAQAGKPAPNREWLVIAISVAGFFGAAVLIGLLFRHRLHGVRVPLVHGAQSRKFPLI